MNSRYETPDAIQHDAHTLVEDARALFDATSEIADEKVAEARKKLENAFQNSEMALSQFQKRASAGIAVADKCVRESPYETIGIAFGVGALLTYLISRRD